MCVSVRGISNILLSSHPQTSFSHIRLEKNSGFLNFLVDRFESNKVILIWNCRRIN